MKKQREQEKRVARKRLQDAIERTVRGSGLGLHGDGAKESLRLWSRAGEGCFAKGLWKGESWVVKSFTINIPRWHPAKLNQVIQGHWSNGHRLKKIDKVLIAAYASNIPKAEGKRRVSLHIILNKGQRGGDTDSYFKSLGDALVSSGLLTDEQSSRCGIYAGDVLARPEKLGFTYHT